MQLQPTGRISILQWAGLPENLQIKTFKSLYVLKTMLTLPYKKYSARNVGACFKSQNAGR